VLLRYNGNENLRKVHPCHKKRKRDHHQEQQLLINSKFAYVWQQVVKLESPFAVLLLFHLFGFGLGDESAVGVSISALHLQLGLAFRLGGAGFGHLLLGRHFGSFLTLVIYTNHCWCTSQSAVTIRLTPDEVNPNRQ
jgi:hypothetical protein